MSTAAGMALEGERTTGQDVRTQNVTACMAVANIVKTSLGPVGLDKMLVDDVGEVTITNDGATILKMLDVEHPAARVLVELADLQDKEVGDGTTSVVIVAAELLRRANELVRHRVHPTSIISGYRLALRESVRFIREHLIVPSGGMERDWLLAAAKTSMSSKLIGDRSDFWAEMVVDAMTLVKRVGPDGRARYPVKAVNILKAHGKSSAESQLVRGYALNCRRSSDAMPTHIEGAKIALLDFNLQRFRMAMGVEVLVKDSKRLEEVREQEVKITKARVDKILDAGANVVLTTKGIDDLCLKFLADRGVIGVRRCLKDDLKRIATATGGMLLPNLADLEGEESFDPAALGEAEQVSEERIGDGELIFFRGCKYEKAASIVLRGANEFHLEEVHRSLHDSLSVVRRVLESKSLVAGGGAVEVALSVHLDRFATTLGTREQLAVREFAEALTVIPKTLAVNAAKDATDLVAKLAYFHNAAQTRAEGDEEAAAYNFYGLDLKLGVVRDNLKAGVLEPSMSKVKSLRYATEAAITILRIDDMIKVTPAEEAGGGM